MNKGFFSIFLVLLFVSFMSRAMNQLHQAVRKNDLEWAKLLLKSGADVNKECFGYIPLQIAVSNNALGMVKMLVNNGADINKFTFSYPCSSLDLASWLFPNEGMVRLLLELKADPNCESHCKEIPLHRAALGAQGEIMKILIEARSDVNKPDSFCYTPLHMICLAQKEIHHRGIDGLEAIKLLLKNGADMNARDIRGKTPQDLANNPAKKDLLKK